MFDHYLNDNYVSPVLGGLTVHNERQIDAFASYYYLRRTEYVAYTQKLPTGQAIVLGLTQPNLGVAHTLAVSFVNAYAPYTDV